MCSCSSEVSLRISVKGKKLLTSGQRYRSQREQQWQLHHPLGEGIPLLGALLDSICKVFSCSAQLLVSIVTCSQPISITVAEHPVIPEVIEKSCPGEASGTTVSPILSQRVDAVLQVHLVQRQY